MVGLGIADARIPLWEKFIYLAAYAAFSGSARKPAGAIPWVTPSCASAS